MECHSHRESHPAESKLESAMLWLHWGGVLGCYNVEASWWWMTVLGQPRDKSRVLVREDPRRKSYKDPPPPACGISVRAKQEAALGMMDRWKDRCKMEAITLFIKLRVSVWSLFKLHCSSDLCFGPTLPLSTFTLFITLLNSIGMPAAPHNHHSSLLLQISLQFPADPPKVCATSTELSSTQGKLSSTQIAITGC
jgi:hypothetical protein